MDQSTKALAKKISRARFTPEEDEELRRLVAEHGTDAWMVIAAAMPTRSVRQCRDRWYHYLSKTPPGDPWTSDEEGLLLAMVDRAGVRWERVTHFFPARSERDVRRRWLSVFQSASGALRGAAHGKIVATGQLGSQVVQLSSPHDENFKDDQSSFDLLCPDYFPFLDE
jgi:hypothetical protein